jgi:hypothetical protein
MNAVLVSGGAAVRQLDELGMRSTERGIPQALSASQPVGCWLAAVAGFYGHATRLGQVAEASADPEAGATGTAALVVCDERIFGIVDAEKLGAQVWFATDLAGLKVATEGTTGLFAKRPQQVVFSNGAWEVRVGKVARVRNVNGQDRAQSAQEATLLAALTGSPQ